MDDSPFDAVDRGIIYQLQRNARTTITDIAAYLDVSDNTVRNRIQHLEDEEVIQGYSADIDFDAIDIQHHYQFVCTARVSEREELAERALDVPGVIEIRTLMTGTRNTYVTAAGSDKDEITRIATAIDEIGLEIDEENLIRWNVRQPLEKFRLEYAD